ncbi:MAG: helix-turn-helix domain-containing protein [Bosea sp.]|nr:helix-turn-helix domain-containing protein [Bosea sp. (in: a-proteobacteria)]
MNDGHKIIEGLDDVLAWTEGDQSAARILKWEAPTSIDVRRVRDKLGMTQRQFAARFGLKLDTLRNWEQDKRCPDATARVLLTLIDRDPEMVKRALAI